MPTQNERILTLVKIGFLPENAVNLIQSSTQFENALTNGDNFPDQELALLAVVTPSDQLRVQTFMAYAMLADARYRSLWNAVPAVP